MEKYKLKKDARHFFKEKLSREIGTLEYWNEQNIPVELLDEQPKVYVVEGKSETLPSGAILKDICGWKSDGKEAHFHFTVYVDDIEHNVYDKVKRQEVLDKIQGVLNTYYKN